MKAFCGVAVQAAPALWRWLIRQLEGQHTFLWGKAALAWPGPWHPLVRRGGAGCLSEMLCRGPGQPGRAPRRGRAGDAGASVLLPQPRNRYRYSTNGSTWLCAHREASSLSARRGPAISEGSRPVTPQQGRLLAAHACLRASRDGVGAQHSPCRARDSAEEMEQQDGAHWWRCSSSAHSSSTHLDTGGSAVPVCDTGNHGLGVSFTLRGIPRQPCVPKPLCCCQSLEGNF